MAGRHRPAGGPALTRSIDLYLGTIPIATGDALAERWEHFAEELGRAFGCAIGIHRARDYLDLVDRLVAADVSIGWVSPFAAATAVEAGTIRPLALAERGGATGYHSALVARPDGRFASVGELCRARVAWVDRNSASGYGVMRAHLVDSGCDLGRLFSVELFCGSHRGVTHAVLEGRADVGATFVPRDGDLGGLRTLASVGPIPSDFLCAGPALSASRFGQLQRLLVDGAGPVAAAARALLSADAFVAPHREHLDVLRRLRSDFDR